MVDLDTLRQFPYFEGMDQEQLKWLGSITTKKSVPAGTKVFDEGEDADTLYIIIRGEVAIQYPIGPGRFLGVQSLTAGDLLVWSAIVEPYKTTSIGIAKQDTLLLAIRADKLREFFETDPALGQMLMHEVAKMLSGRLSNARGKFASLFAQLDTLLEQSKS